NQLL
ncbi:lrgB-like family protein, partial [Vibrio parahaemolyticus V-223/04]